MEVILNLKEFSACLNSFCEGFREQDISAYHAAYVGAKSMVKDFLFENLGLVVEDGDIRISPLPTDYYGDVPGYPGYIAGRVYARVVLYEEDVNDLPLHVEAGCYYTESREPSFCVSLVCYMGHTMKTFWNANATSKERLLEVIRHYVRMCKLRVQCATCGLEW